MRKIYARIAAALALLVVALGLLAWLSYTTTQRRTYGAILPFVLQVTVVDANGNPVPRSNLRLIDADTLEAAGNPFFEIDPRAGSTGDERGQVDLRFRGQPVEAEDWRLFWVFRRVVSEPRGFDAYRVVVSAPGHEQKVIALPALLAERVEAPPGSAEMRYRARVTI